MLYYPEPWLVVTLCMGCQVQGIVEGFVVAG